MRTLGEDTNAYYRFHAGLYDMTRWAFLFGRSALIQAISDRQPRRVLEVGCGTGSNLRELKKRLPDAECVGVDPSADMLRIAKRKARDVDIRWIESTYPSLDVAAALAHTGKPDVVLFSYVLSMINPGHDPCLAAARDCVAPGGVVCVVDFHSAPFAWFRQWMAMNHVRIDSQLPVAIQKCGELALYEERRAMLGLWRYALMMARPRDAMVSGTGNAIQGRADAAFNGG